VIGAVRRAAPVKNSFVQFSELHVSAVVNFSPANLTNKFVLCSVRCTVPRGMTFCCGIPIQESDGALSTQPIQFLAQTAYAFFSWQRPAVLLINEYECVNPLYPLHIPINNFPTASLD